MNKVLFLTLALITLSLQRPQKSIQCPQGHLPFSNTCKPITYVEGCSSYHPNNKCKDCQYGYLPDNGKCSSNTNQTNDCCASYGSDGTCLQCSSGLFSSDPYCYRNQIYGCIDKAGNKCVVCGYGLALYNGLCITPIPECASYDAKGICKECKPHNKLINSYCYPFPQVDNCQSSNQYGCLECSEGYYLSSKRTCQQFEPGCLKYWQQKCISCLPNFILYKNKCFIQACKIYNQNGCAQCHKGYTYYQGKCQHKGCLKFVNKVCVQCRDGLRLSAQGCVQPLDYQCTSCTQGYQWVNGNCLKVIFGCVKYNDNSQCQTCRAPFQLTINGQCQILGCQKYCQEGCLGCYSPFIISNHICSIPNCKKYSSSGCSQCDEGFLLANRHCHPKDPNCASYDLINNKPTCTKCVDQYYLFQNSCKPAQRGCDYDDNGNCKCKSPFMMKNGNCIILGCNQYDWETCLSCSAPFRYNSKAQACFIPYCQKYGWKGCIACEKGWLVNDGNCMKGDPYCISYDQNGKCQACKKGFVLSQEGCRKNIPFCTQFSQDNLSCLKCEQGYKLYQGWCKKVITNCQSMDFQNEICTCCDQNYYLINGQCNQKDPNCLTYSQHQTQKNTQYCSECKEHFFFNPSNNRCEQKEPGCVYKGCTCVSCIQPFRYDSNRQNCFIPGCNKYNRIGCEYCVTPFSLIENNCVIKHCSSYSRKGCLQCENGYTVSNQGICVRINPNCQTYKGAECVQCKEKFTLFKDNCVIKDQYCVDYNQNGIICTQCVSNYHPDHDGKCRPDEPGCIYTNGVCTACKSPFKHHPSYNLCEIPNCQQADFTGCLNCKYPFQLNSKKECTLSNCLRWDNKGCLQCKPLYHAKKGGCIPDSPNCLMYSIDGNCELCSNKWVVGADGECVKGNRACIEYSSQDRSKCLSCSQGYFLNRFFQCEKQDGKCQAYTNGVCSKCKDKFFLYSDICFPYTPGCVHYRGKDCTQCKNHYVLKNGECFHWKKQDMALLGGDDVYDFDITPIDVRQSKYYINNLSPASAIGKYFFSSYYGAGYQDCSLSTLEGFTSKGWKAKVANQDQYIGVTLSGQPAIFYALQLQAVDQSYITQFYLEYSVDGTQFIRVQNVFSVPSKIAQGMTTIYFTGLYAKSIRIKITGYNNWPAARIQFFYYDMIRFRKISNLKSLTYLQETINSNFVDRVDNQIYINQIYFFNPAASCSIKEMCFTGLQLCEPRDITDLTLTFQDPNNYVTQFYLTYSVDGRNYNCYKNCKKFTINNCSNNSYSMTLDDLKAQGVRVYPTNYKGTPKFSPTFFYN